MNSAISSIIRYLQEAHQHGDYLFRMDNGNGEGKSLHCHDFWEIRFLARENKAKEGRPSEIILTPPGVRHAVVERHRHRLALVINLLPASVEFFFFGHGLGGNPNVSSLGNIPCIYQIVNLIRDYIEADDNLPTVLCKDLTQLMLSALTDVLLKLGNQTWNRTSPEDVARWFMERNFAEPSLTLAKIAEPTGRTSQSLNRIFRKKCHCSLYQYLMQLRLQHARDLLASPDMTVMKAMHLSGFADRSNFTRQFRRVYGLSPAECRKGCLPCGSTASCATVRSDGK